MRILSTRVYTKWHDWVVEPGKIRTFKRKVNRLTKIVANTSLSVGAPRKGRALPYLTLGEHRKILSALGPRPCTARYYTPKLCALSVKFFKSELWWFSLGRARTGVSLVL